jgi:hypothetical protein
MFVVPGTACGIFNVIAVIKFKMGPFPTARKHDAQPSTSSLLDEMRLFVVLPPKVRNIHDDPP